MPGAKLRGAGEIDALGHGDVTIILDVSGKDVLIMLRDCIHTPKILHNLVSLVRVTDAGFKVHLEGSGLQFIQPNGTVAGFADKHDCLYYMQLKETPISLTSEDTSFATKSGVKTLAQWHHVLSHTPVDVIKLMASKNMVEGLDIDLSDQMIPHCAMCWEAKQITDSFPQESKTVYTAPGQLIVSDVWGPLLVTSISKEKYTVTFTDVYSRFTTVHFLLEKGQVAEVWENFVEFVENQTKNKVKKFFADNGREFISERVRAFC